MANKVTIKFKKGEYKKTVLKRAVALQTARLIEYAKQELQEMIMSHTFENRTFNLADSYVWAVYYDKKEQGHGYAGVKKATKKSYLHEWSREPIPVSGRKEATNFLREFKKTVDDGWVIVWAACAPYARYLDKDERVGKTKTNRFWVISQRYDAIKSVLEPKCKVELRVGV